LRSTPLFEEHQARGAKLGDFQGWALPLQFAGIIAEHLHTRSQVSVFDCSHMGKFILRGADAIRTFEGLVINDMAGLGVGRCRYTSLLDVCGGIIDDVIAMRLSEDELWAVTNATPFEKVSRILRRVCRAEDVTFDTAKVDVQGPRARDVLLALGITDVGPLEYYDVCRTRWGDADIVVSRAGYTGELGYECFVPNDLAVPLWRELLSREGVRPAGLGARDTLRTEMGYTLYGQDVDESRTTLEAGMGRFIDWDGEFHAKEFLLMQREMGRYKIRTGLRSMSRSAPRRGQELCHEGRPVGTVTSGCYGPSVGCGIGMAYVPIELSTPGTRLTAGPRNLEVETAAFPLYKGGTCRARPPA